MSDALYDLYVTLNILAFDLNKIMLPIQIVLGTIGNLLNIIIFTRRSLRNSSCSIYFIASSINNLFVIYTGIITRYLSLFSDNDIANNSSVLCKLKYYIIYTALSLVLWLTVLASIDRFLCSSRKVSYRRLSRNTIARRTLIGTFLLIFVIHIHMLIYYDVSEGYCNIFLTEYQTFFDMFFFVISCILPIILMTIFGLLMINNIRQSRNRVHPQQSNQRLKSNDRQMVLMLAIQILLTALFSVPYSIINVYYTIRYNILQYEIPLYDFVILLFTNNIAGILYFSNPIIGFYIYTLCGKRFRLELKQLICSTYQCK